MPWELAARTITGGRGGGRARKGTARGATYVTKELEAKRYGVVL